MATPRTGDRCHWRGTKPRVFREEERAEAFQPVGREAIEDALLPGEGWGGVRVLAPGPKGRRC